MEVEPSEEHQLAGDTSLEPPMRLGGFLQRQAPGGFHGGRTGFGIRSGINFHVSGGALRGSTGFHSTGFGGFRGSGGFPAALGFAEGEASTEEAGASTEPAAAASMQEAAVFAAGVAHSTAAAAVHASEQHGAEHLELSRGS